MQSSECGTDGKPSTAANHDQDQPFGHTGQLTGKSLANPDARRLESLKTKKPAGVASGLSK
jgi:hypothetical protein|tara:strand:- start:738 stop:920 length:183 start_codon:yes stop_codon:yes gene_type:complete